MQAEMSYSKRSQLAPFVVAAALVIGAFGGYVLRGIATPGSAAQAASAASETSRTVLIPRSAREDEGTTVPGSQLVPRALREGPEREDGTR